MVKRISYTVAGFVGGIAFLISCGGGGPGEVSISPVQTVNADTVISSQMYCDRLAQLINRGTTPFGGTASDPFPESLFCLDTANNPVIMSIQSAYQQGWKIQDINSAEVVFYK